MFLVFHVSTSKNVEKIQIVIRQKNFDTMKNLKVLFNILKGVEN